MKRERAVTRLLPFVAGPLCALALAMPATAAGGQHTGATHPARAAAHTIVASAAAGYFSTAGSNRSYNWSGGSVLRSRSGIGKNTVTFDGLGAITGGNVQVTTLNSARTCSVVNWGPGSGNLSVNVNCYTFGGVLANADFTLLVTQPLTAPHGALAYDWNYNKSKTYTATGPYQYNSAHHQNHITHLGLGQYKITMPGVGTTGTSGTVKVSAYGAGGGDCQLQSWSGQPAGEVIFVNCYSASGQLQNRLFVVSFARANNLLGMNNMTTANALANKPTVTAYIPHVQWKSHTGAPIDLVETSSHVFTVRFHGSQGNSADPGGGGNVQVTAQGNSYAHCIPTQWTQGSTPSAVVACKNNSNHLVASKFTIQWVTP